MHTSVAAPIPNSVHTALKAPQKPLSRLDWLESKWWGKGPELTFQANVTGHALLKSAQKSTGAHLISSCLHWQALSHPLSAWVPAPKGCVGNYSTLCLSRHYYASKCASVSDITFVFEDHGENSSDSLSKLFSLVSPTQKYSQPNKILTKQ